MNTRILVIAALLAGFLLPSCAKARPAAPETDSVSAVSPASLLAFPIEEVVLESDTLDARFRTDWESLAMQGKLQMDGLPTRLSVKVYMERDRSVIVSARAPILGEVARMEILGDSVTLVNKNSRTYHVAGLGSAMAARPGLLGEFQQILQGRIDADGTGTAQLRAFDVAAMEGKMEASFNYLYGPEGWTLAVVVAINGTPLNAELQLSYPNYDPTPLEPTDLSKRYKEVGLRELMKF